MKESDDKYSNRIADAEQLTKEVQAIYSLIPQHYYKIFFLST